jgi:DNA-binding NtrC family response regulator
MNEKFSILIVDDEFIVRDSLSKWFIQDGYRVGVAENGAQALKMMNEGPWDVIFIDIKMPGMDGLELQKRIKEIDPTAIIIIITAFASVDSAVKALKEGAYDYVTKPIDPDYLSHLVKNVIKQKKMMNENIKLKEQVSELMMPDELVGESQEIKRVIELAKAVAPTDTTVMIRGESGVGKELIARLIHSYSHRRYFPFISVNCGAIPDTLLESELFGHEKGAFTDALYRRKGKFEIANGGTVFLDEVGTISLKMQVQLLRVLETKQFTRVGGNEVITSDFRVICATNCDLENLVKEEKFREDLYYRLNVFTIFVPPLRERRSDIPLIANYYLKKFSAIMHKPVTEISPEAMDLLIRYNWPGNVRELRNAIERAMVLAKPPAIRPEDLPIRPCDEIEPEDETLEAVERAHILKILNRTNWNITRSARILGIDRVTLYHKIERYNLKRNRVN